MLHACSWRLQRRPGHRNGCQAHATGGARPRPALPGPTPSAHPPPSPTPLPALPSAATDIAPSRTSSSPPPPPPPPSSTPPLRTLYPPAQPTRCGHLRLSPAHELYYETYGSAQGLPAVFLHGGPGAGCYPNHARFFDPARYQVVLLDQRGCGRSRPRGRLQDNHTEALVADLELLRAHLGLAAWVVLGGSWGSTLALAYAQRHPGRVLGMALRGVCLMRPHEVEWMFRRGGAAALRPMGWQRFAAQLGAPGGRGSDPLLGYYARLLSGDSGTRDAAARAWSQWEWAVGGGACPDLLSWDGEAWHQLPRPAPAAAPPPARAAGQEAKSTAAAPAAASATGQPGGGGTQQAQQRAAPGPAPLAPDQRAPPSPDSGPGAGSMQQLPDPALEWHMRWQEGGEQAREQLQALLQLGLRQPGEASLSQGATQALLECHYSVHGAFLLEEPLLAHMHHIKGRRFPCIAVQGQADLICPPGTAYDLHQAWPEMELRLVPHAGHSMYDPAIAHELVCATDRLLQLVG